MLRLFCSAGIEAACPGGEIMYSTCTLSQVQNQGVVEQAIYLAQENHGIRLEVSQTHAVNVNKKLYCILETDNSWILEDKYDQSSKYTK